MTITIRPLETHDEYHACEDLQRRVWAMPDDLEVVPLHLLMPVAKQGGLALGAFDGDELVGFVFGFLGTTADGAPLGVPKHCSHMMGVDPSYQSAGLGFRLKLAQREFALAQGHSLVTWTYDPLQSRNAYLNIHKLGAVCRTYIADYYGPMSDGLNAGLPSDRFRVEWWIEREPGADPGGLADDAPYLPVNRMERTPSGLIAPGELILDSDAQGLQVEIPANYQAIKTDDPALALEWRLATRRLFQTYFEAGYVAVDVVSQKDEGGRRSYYLLQKAP